MSAIKSISHVLMLDVVIYVKPSQSNALVAETNRFMFMVAKTLCANRTISHASVQPSHTHGQWKNTLEVNVQLVLHCSTHLFS